jgi:hypothetical protein
MIAMNEATHEKVVKTNSQTNQTNSHTRFPFAHLPENSKERPLLSWHQSKEKSTQ